MTAPEATGSQTRYADLTDRTLADALVLEDGMDEAWHTGGAIGPPPGRDTCHGCRDWADHDHDADSGRRVDLEPADLDDRRERAIERAVHADMAHDPDEAAWGLYRALHALDEQRAREAAAVRADAVVDRSWAEVER